jgi:hypothetical protein
VRFDDDVECVLDLTEATNQGHGAFADLEYVQRVSIDAQRRKLVLPNGFEVDSDMLHAAAALEEFERTLGLEHPETLAARFRLAILYVAADDLESARAVGEPLDAAFTLAFPTAARRAELWWSEADRRRATRR